MATSADIIAFKNRFPELEAVPDPTIASCLNTADVFVDPYQYDPNEYWLARMLFAAWLVTMTQQNIANTTVDGTGMSDLYVRSIRIGERMVNFQQRKGFEQMEKSASPGDALLGTNQYGLLYMQLRYRNANFIAVV